MDSSAPPAAAPTEDVEETLREEDDEEEIKESIEEPSEAPPSREENDEEEHNDGSAMSVGGKLDTAAYCLLEGLLEESSSGDEEAAPVKTTRIRVPIDRVPAVLGRSHKLQVDSFISLGPTKSLSRQHVKISYHMPDGGRMELVREGGEDKWTYLEVKPSDKIEILNRPEEKQDSDKGGFFCMTCLGKNRVVVDGTKVEQGQTVALKHGSTVHISTYSLYFLLPSNGTPATIFLPDRVPSQTAPVAPTLPPAAAKKRKMSSTASVGSTTSTNTPASAPPRLNAMTSLQNELDSIDTTTLREQLTAAVQDNVWERRHQLIGSTLAYRAVLVAAADPGLRHKAETGGGLSRGDLIQWIAQSDEFSVWVTQMLAKLEPKSYQASITKAMIKANYMRTAGSGRYIKWSIPDVSNMKFPWDPKGSDSEEPADNKEEQAAGSSDNEKAEDGENEDEEGSDGDDDGDVEDTGSQEEAGEEEEQEDDAMDTQEEAKESDETNEDKVDL